MVKEEQRFSFGRNWSSYSEKVLDSEKVTAARRDFGTLTEGIVFDGRRFLDVGFGQGLALYLAAERGAVVTGIDIDEGNLKALQNTGQLFSGVEVNDVRIGSILDDDLVASLKMDGGFDIVHSWGVLHHTGSLWKAIDNVSKLVAPGGQLIIAIYNRHWSSPLWWWIKRLYASSPGWIRTTMIVSAYPLLRFALWVMTGRANSDSRGMDFYHDVIDWIGGFPYEYSDPKSVENCLKATGFRLLKRLPPIVPTGNYQWVFSY